MGAALARGRSARGERRKKRMLYRHLKGISADKDTGFTTAPPVARPVRGVNAETFDGMRNGCSAGRHSRPTLASRTSPTHSANTADGENSGFGSSGRLRAIQKLSKCPNRHVGQVFSSSVRTPVKTPYAAPNSVEERPERPPLISEGHTNFQFRPQN